MATRENAASAADCKRIDHDTLKSLLHYDPETGHFTWLRMAHHSRKALIGRRAGWAGWGGYWKIECAGAEHCAHRLAWLYMTGDWPAGEIDHINRNPADNRWENLRLASRAQNVRNTKTRADNSTGQKGVVRRGSKWGARINVDKRHIWLGTFSTFDEAKAAYLSASSEHFGDWAA